MRSITAKYSFSCADSLILCLQKLKNDLKTSADLIPSVFFEKDLLHYIDWKAKFQYFQDSFSPVFFEMLHA